jgi:F0F1-type ATP synthase assembly protein I
MPGPRLARGPAGRCDAVAAEDGSGRRSGGSGSSGPDFARGLTLAFEFAGAVFLFWGLGWLFDAWLGTEPWGQVVGGILGWVGGTLHVYYKTQSGGI